MGLGLQKNRGTIFVLASLLVAIPAIKAVSADLDRGLVINDLVLSPDGRAIAVATEVEGQPYGVYLMSLEDGKINSTIRGRDQHDTSAYSVSFTPDGKTLVIGDGGVRRLSLPSLTALPEPSDPERLVGGVISARVSADGKYLSACLFDSLRIWDLAEDKVVFDFVPSPIPQPTVGGLKCSFSPDATVIMASNSDWHFECNRLTNACSTKRGQITNYAFRPDGKVIATMDGNPMDVKRLVIKAVDGHRVLRSMLAKVPSGPEFYNSMVYSPDGKSLALGGLGIGILEPEKGQIRKLFHSAEFPSVHFLQFTPDGKQIVFVMDTYKSGHDYKLGLWDLASQKMVWTVPIPALPKI